MIFDKQQSFLNVHDNAQQKHAKLKCQKWDETILTAHNKMQPTIVTL